MYTLSRSDDNSEARELHERLLPADVFAEDHEYWVVRDDQREAVGFCSAILRPTSNVVFLSLAAVAPEARGHGLQKRMIRARVRWAKRAGACGAVTYVAKRNYASMCNLLKCGFRFYNEAVRDEDKDDFHFLRIEF